MNGLIVPEIQGVCNHTLWIFVIKRFWNQLKEEVQLSCIVQFSRRRVAVENEAPILKILRPLLVCLSTCTCCPINFSITYMVFWKYSSASPWNR